MNGYVHVEWGFKNTQKHNEILKTNLPVFLLSSVSCKENVNMNSKYLLFQISVLFVVSFNTIGAVRQVQAKLAVRAQDVVYYDVTATRRVAEPSQYKMAALPAASTVAPAASIKNPVLLKPLPIPIAPTAFQGPDAVLVPILLYHRIDVSLNDSQYYVSPDKFEEQMKLLQDWGYTTITTDLLVEAISKGADLPLHPVLITFDDGHLNNYTTAFPIMQKYGFTGVVYIIGEYMGTPGYMNADQVKEMAEDGWEVGSHSMRHPDLTLLDREQQIYEIIESRRFLETELDVPVLTFAYPFGASDKAVINLAYSAGYIAGMGLGYTYDQGTSNLFALQRRGVDGTRDINAFASFLPWQGDPVYLPADTTVSSLTQDPTNTLP